MEIAKRFGDGAPVAFPDGLPALRRRISALRDDSHGAEQREAVMVELETAYEELRVADEEVRTQQAEIRQLLEAQHLLRWQHRRMLEMLPVAVLTTDAGGTITASNAAAASLVGIRLPHLLGKPLLSLVALEDRAELRAQMTGLARGVRLRRTVTLLTREGRPVLVEAHAATESTGSGEVSWVLLTARASDHSDRVPGELDLPEALVRLASFSASDLEEPELLRQAGAVCQDALGDRVTLSLNTGSPVAPTSLTATSKLAQAADGAQLSHEQGPCVSAFEHRETVVSADLRSDPRWPAFAVDPRTRGIDGVIAVPLDVGDKLLGALNVYGDVGDPPDSRLIDTAELLAAAVAACLYERTVRRELASTAAELEQALTSRATIDQAKGMVMADRQCTADEAFAHLVSLSSTHNLKLRDVARQLVERRSGGGQEDLRR